MKYLKTFESKSVEKFETIGEVEWGNLVELSKLSIDFTEREFKEVQSIYPDTKILPGRVGQYIHIKTTVGYLELNCLPDEWYLVWCGVWREDHPIRFYKCDQFDGLLDCLRFLKKGYRLK